MSSYKNILYLVSLLFIFLSHNILASELTVKEEAITSEQIKNYFLNFKLNLKKPKTPSIYNFSSKETEAIIKSLQGGATSPKLHSYSNFSDFDSMMKRKPTSILIKNGNNRGYVVPSNVLTPAQRATLDRYKKNPTLYRKSLDTNKNNKAIEFPVCWKNHIKNKKENKRLRKAVENVVKERWGKAGNIILSGWNDCSNSLKPYVKISWIGDKRASANAYTKAFGSTVELPNKPKGCHIGQQIISVDECVKGIAIHEFGHVLKLAHEQDRKKEDINKRCYASLNIKDINPIVGASYTSLWDFKSPLNYCNKNWLNGKLSPTDKTIMKLLYPYHPEKK